jgi:hypothetical protein
MFHDLIHDAPRHVAGYREADPHIAATRRKDGSIDADKLAPQVHQRAAGIPRIDGRIRLYEILISLLADSGATKGTDNTRRNSLAETEWIAHSDHEITDIEPIAIAHLDGLERMRSLQAEYGQICARVTPDELSHYAAPVLRHYLYGRGLRNYVVCSQHVALLLVDDDPGPYSLALALEFPWHLQKLAEDRVPVEGVILLDSPPD